VLLLAAAFALPGTVAAGLTGVDQPCMPDGQCGSSVLTCGCCLSGQADHSLPAPPPPGPTTLVALNAVACVALPFLTAPSSAEALSSAAVQAHSPTHGYRSASLSILLSTFLI
jgi:hypothetical protein